MRGAMVLSVLVMLVAAAPAAAQWSAPAPVSEGGRIGQSAQQMVGNDRGDALVAWTRKIGDEQSVLEFARRHPDGRWDPTEVLTPGHWRPTVALSERGDAAVLWSEAVDIGTRLEFSFAGVLMPVDGPRRPFRIVAGDCTLGNLGFLFDAAGNATLFGSDCDNLFYAEAPRGGGFGAVGTVPRAAGERVLGATYGIADDGTLVVGWQDYVGVYAAVRPPGGAFRPRVLASNEHPGGVPLSGVPGITALEVNRAGATILTWHESPGSENNYRRMAVYKTPGADGFGPPVRLPDIGDGATAAIDPRGKATVVMPGFFPGHGDGTWAVPVDAGGIGTPEWIVDYTFCHGDADYDAAGQLYVVWNVSPTRCSGSLQVFAAVRPDGGAFTTTPLATELISYPPQVAASGVNGAVASWSTGTQAPTYLRHLFVSTWAGTAAPLPSTPTPTPTPGGDGAVAGGGTPTAGGTPALGAATTGGTAPAALGGNATSPRAATPAPVTVRATLRGRRLTVRLKHATTQRVRVVVRSVGQRPRTLAQRTVRVSARERTVRIKLRRAVNRVDVRVVGESTTVTRRVRG